MQLLWTAYKFIDHLFTVSQISILTSNSTKATVTVKLEPIVLRFLFSVSATILIGDVF